jgi:biopolymer transport protein ExbB
MDIFFIIALVVTSIIAVAFMVERGLALRWAKVVPPSVERAVQNYSGPRDLRHLQHVCEQSPSPLARLVLFAAEHLDWPKSENIEVVETRARHEVSRLERGLVVLEIIVGIAPLLGLVGTIYGLITLFGSMGGQSADNAKFAQGISLALNATLLGLLIAIPSLVAWSYYNKKVETIAVEMESLCDEFLRKHYRATEETNTIAIAETRTEEHAIRQS